MTKHDTDLLTEIRSLRDALQEAADALNRNSALSRELRIALFDSAARIEAALKRLEAPK